ncbi:hypothetical protein OPQ81_005350 [Rhizoctonia solani]|nr:hypothetical protein OPQ81_005350 [Rhizoctonia solani]
MQLQLPNTSTNRQLTKELLELLLALQNHAQVNAHNALLCSINMATTTIQCVGGRQGTSCRHKPQYSGPYPNLNQLNTQNPGCHQQNKNKKKKNKNKNSLEENNNHMGSSATQAQPTTTHTTTHNTNQSMTTTNLPNHLHKVKYIELAKLEEMLTQDANAIEAANAPKEQPVPAYTPPTHMNIPTQPTQVSWVAKTTQTVQPNQPAKETVDYEEDYMMEETGTQ